MNIYKKFLKRIFDIIIAATFLLLFIPLMIIVSLLIKLEDGGEVFYKGLRIGRNGRPFHIIKFRTMVMDADKMGGSSTSNDDPRITRIGRVLRKYKLDELPQLINVLKGDMSIVGPRPEVEEYVRLFTEDEMKILSVRPGITDWASIWNPDEGKVLSKYDDPDRAYMEIIRPKKLELQKKYIDELSFISDVKIILLTIKTVIFRRQAHHSILQEINQ